MALFVTDSLLRRVFSDGDVTVKGLLIKSHASRLLQRVTLEEHRGTSYVALNNDFGQPTSHWHSVHGRRVPGTEGEDGQQDGVQQTPTARHALIHHRAFVFDYPVTGTKVASAPLYVPGVSILEGSAAGAGAGAGAGASVDGQRDQAVVTARLDTTTHAVSLFVSTPTAPSGGDHEPPYAGVWPLLVSEDHLRQCHGEHLLPQPSIQRERHSGDPNEVDAVCAVARGLCVVSLVGMPTSLMLLRHAALRHGPVVTRRRLVLSGQHVFHVTVRELHGQLVVQVSFQMCNDHGRALMCVCMDVCLCVVLCVPSLRPGLRPTDR